MRNEIAEWMLSQAAPPEQARTIIGDLLEAQHGPIEFWVGVLRATTSIAGRDPRRLLVSFTGFMIQFGVLAVFAWAISVVSPYRFLAVYSALVGLVLMWQAIFRFVVRRLFLRLGHNSPFLSLANVIYYAGISVLFVWCLMRYAGQSIWSALGVLIVSELLAFWRLRRRRATAPGTVA